VNMLEAVALNQNHKNPDLRLFELGNVYRRKENRTEEDMHLGLLLTGQRYPENWNNTNRPVSYADLRNMIDLLLQRFGLYERCRFGEVQADYFAHGQTIELGKKVLGHIGSVQSVISKKFDIDQPVLFAVVNWNMLIRALGDGRIRYKAVSRFPIVRRDFSLLLDQKVTFAEIEGLARKTEKNLLREVGLFDVYEGKNLEPGKKSYAVRFLMSSDERTLKDSEVDDAMNRIRAALENNLGATLR